MTKKCEGSRGHDCGMYLIMYDKSNTFNEIKM